MHPNHHPGPESVQSLALHYMHAGIDKNNFYLLLTFDFLVLQFGSWWDDAGQVR